MTQITFVDDVYIYYDLAFTQKVSVEYTYNL